MSLMDQLLAAQQSLRPVLEAESDDSLKVDSVITGVSNDRPLVLQTDGSGLISERLQRVERISSPAP